MTDVITEAITEAITDKAARAKLYGKLSAVTAAVSRIPKNGVNAFHKYKYATESDITDGLRELLAAHGLAFLPPSVVTWERSQTLKRDGSPGDDLTRVQMQFGIGCCDTGEVYTSIVWGEGQDSGDKGFYKAYTGAVKYFLMKTFLIATGDDPEQDVRQPQSNGHASYSAPQPRPQPQRPAQPATNGRRPPSRAGLIQRITDLEGQLKAIGVEHERKPFEAYTDAQLVELGKEIKSTLDKAYDAIEATAD